MSRVTILEVGPRDGLQNEKTPVSTADKLRLIALLAQAGVQHIEATAFVSPRWVPQMADHAAVMAALPKGGVVYSALVPNAQGAEAALAAGAQALAVFTAASESFSRKNTNCSIEEGIARFEPVARLAKAAGVPLRGYISCCLDCPFEGEIAPSAVADVARRLADVGCDEIAISDTLGRGTPERTKRAFEAVLAHLPAGALAGHFHDTFGHAIENVQAAYDLGVRVFDGAAGGLGGCPYAPGAAGNLATEKLVEHFAKAGVATGIDPVRLGIAADFARALRNPAQASSA